MYQSPVVPKWIWLVARPDVRRLKVRGVVGSAGGVRDDVERGQGRADANANFGIV